MNRCHAFERHLASGTPAAADEHIQAAESASSLVELGLNLIARASEGSSEGYFVAGHRGAGLIAAELFARDNSLD